MNFPKFGSSSPYGQLFSRKSSRQPDQAQNTQTQQNAHSARPQNQRADFVQSNSGQPPMYPGAADAQGSAGRASGRPQSPQGRLSKPQVATVGAGARFDAAYARMKQPHADALAKLNPQIDALTAKAVDPRYTRDQKLAIMKLRRQQMDRRDMHQNKIAEFDAASKGNAARNDRILANPHINPPASPRRELYS